MKLTILLAGRFAASPGQGGAAWAVLQYLLGFRELGHDVYFVEPLLPGRLEPGASLQDSEYAAYFRSVMTEFGLEGSSALLLDGTRETVGLSYVNLRDVARRADLLINNFGLLKEEDLVAAIPLRVYLDLDPAFTQLWHYTQGIDMGLDGHNRFVTVGLALGDADCPIPTGELPWIRTLQPVVLEHWPVARDITYDAFTTVGNWRTYGPIEYGGAIYGQKVHSVRQFLALPSLTDEKFMPAFMIHPDETRDLGALSEHGWHLLDPTQVAGSPSAYRRFVQGSKAELGIAKSGYVVSRSGWFSDRSACYLASGRPVIAQQTGFARVLPAGEGLFAFETIDDVLEAIDGLKSDYDRHARAARAVAEEWFDSRKVLSRLLAAVGAEPRRPSQAASTVSGSGDNYLKGVLERLLSAHFNRRRRVTRLNRVPSPYHSSFRIEDVAATLDDGTELAIVLKDVSLTGVLEGAREVKPRFLFHPLREIDTYRAILGPELSGPPVCYGALVDPEIERYWLFLEKVPGTRLYQLSDFAVWEQVARWLAGMHSTLVRSERLEQVNLLRYDGEFYRLWIDRARTFLRHAGRARHASIEWLAERYDQVVERLLGLPPAFIHGEFYPSNVLIEETSAGVRICPVDWETAALGPALIDLAALAGGRWTDEERTRLVDAYLAALPADGPTPSRESVLADFHACQLHLAVQWLGWSAEWSPSPEHGHDWMAEAIHAAEKLDLG